MLRHANVRAPTLKSCATHRSADEHDLAGRSWLNQQLRQVGDVGGLVACEQRPPVVGRQPSETLSAVFLKSRVDVDAADPGPGANGRPCTQRRVLASMLDVDCLYDDPFAARQFPKRATRRLTG